MNGCFFYIILTAHYIVYGDGLVKILGYGITINPKKRSKQYSDHTGTEQEFTMLFYGKREEIKTLESIIKQRVASKTHKIYGEPVEWISPSAGMTVADLNELVRDTIKQENFNSISILNENYLPFNNLDHHSNITLKEMASNPDKYLTKILTKNKKSVKIKS
jgi:hypothetical protein